MTREIPAEQLSVTRRAGSRRENGASCPDGLLLRLACSNGDVMQLNQPVALWAD